MATRKFITKIVLLHPRKFKAKLVNINKLMIINQPIPCSRCFCCLCEHGGWTLIWKLYTSCKLYMCVLISLCIFDKLYMYMCMYGRICVYILYWYIYVFDGKYGVLYKVAIKLWNLWFIQTLLILTHTSGSRWIWCVLLITMDIRIV